MAAARLLSKMTRSTKGSCVAFAGQLSWLIMTHTDLLTHVSDTAWALKAGLLACYYSPHKVGHLLLFHFRLFDHNNSAWILVLQKWEQHIDFGVLFHLKGKEEKQQMPFLSAASLDRRSVTLKHNTHWGNPILCCHSADCNYAYIERGNPQISQLPSFLL